MSEQDRQKLASYRWQVQEYDWAEEERKWPRALENSIVEVYLLPCLILSLCLGFALLQTFGKARLLGESGRAWRGFGIAIFAWLLWAFTLLYWVLPQART